MRQTENNPHCSPNETSAKSILYATCASKQKNETRILLFFSLRQARSAHSLFLFPAKYYIIVAYETYRL